MRLRQIELFHAILTTGSLTGAANLLNVSQPAASKALQHAEQQLGFALFSRVRGRLQPTREALLLRNRVENIAQELHDLQRLTANIARPDSSPLRVTCTPTVAQTMLPDAVMRLRKAFPETTAELATQHSAAMYESILLHETDLGFTLQDLGHPAVRSEPLCRGQVMVIAPPGWWPEAEISKPLALGKLAGQPMIGIAVHDSFGNMLHGQLSHVVPAPQTAVWVQTYQLAYALVARGQGLALVDPFTASRTPGQSVQTRPLKLRLDVVLYAVYRMDNPLNPVQQRFIHVMRELATRMLGAN